MKICPRCQKTYDNDALNFCLEDGTVLTAAGPPVMPDTVIMNEPRATQQPMPPPGQAWSAPQQQQYQQQPAQYAMQPAKKSSKTWVWILLILGILVLLCGGGFLTLILLGISQADKTGNNAFVANSRTVATSTTTPSSNNSSTTTASTSGRNDITPVDLNMFVKEFSLYGTTELNGDELTMGSKQKGFYYVLVAPDNYTTDNADTRVTVRNAANANSSLGYGLIFHSDPEPLKQDYAFLIDTKRNKYRVVHHDQNDPKKEITVINWTASPAINGGAGENTLEARDHDSKIDLYINGTMVNSIKNVYGYSNGVVGLYSGDGIKVAFKDLEIRR